MKIYFFIPLFLMLSCGSTIDSDYIKKQTWQYDSGYKVTKGDFLEFNERIVLKNDSIIVADECRAIIIKELRKDNELIIKSLSGEKGVYINTVEFR